jgi:hypothetical protein
MILEVTMTEAEKAYVKEVCSFFYPSSPPEKVDDTLADLAGRMLYSAIEKSKAIDLVPRPTLNPGAGWLLLQAVQIFWRTQRKARIYDAARKAVALQYKSEYELAKLGL